MVPSPPMRSLGLPWFPLPWDALALPRVPLPWESLGSQGSAPTGSLGLPRVRSHGIPLGSQGFPSNGIPLGSQRSSPMRSHPTASRFRFAPLHPIVRRARHSPIVRRSLSGRLLDNPEGEDRGYKGDQLPISIKPIFVHKCNDKTGKHASQMGR